ncbi:hypothetical protein MMC08_002356, partial [Hypocenomyce scalaris]|nr:hypothetical protein [Hypocenomyce scalaris]
MPRVDLLLDGAKDYDPVPVVAQRSLVPAARFKYAARDNEASASFVRSCGAQMQQSKRQSFSD